MFGSRDTPNESPPQFWIEARRLPKATASTSYRKLDATLESIGFIAGVREICRPAEEARATPREQLRPCATCRC